MAIPLLNCKCEFEPLVSIIIPVYNTRPYLSQCLDSLVSQTLEEIEIICIDNGSTDGSYEFLLDYAETHDNIIVTRHTEGRQGGARNAGIKIAKGLYIGFVDSDDFVSPDMFQRMYAVAEVQDAQMVVCNIQYYHMNSGYGRNALPTEVLEAEGAASIQKHPLLLRNLTICNKLFSRSLIEEHKICFPQGYYHEDQFFVIAAMVSATRISTIPRSLYFYRKGRSGSVSEYRGPDCMHIFSIMDVIVNFVERHHRYSPLNEIIHEVKVMKLLQIYRLAGPASRRSYFNAMRTQFKAVNLGDSHKLLSRTEIREYELVRRYGYLVYNLYLALRAKYGKMRRGVIHLNKALLAERNK